MPRKPKKTIQYDLFGQPIEESRKANEGMVIEVFLDDHQVRKVLIKSKTWWVLADVLRALGYSSNGSCVVSRNLNNYPNFVNYSTVQTKGGPQQVLVVSLKAIKLLISRSYKSAARRLSRLLGINVHAIRIETSLMDIIERAFADNLPSRQKRCGPYLIDLYFNKSRIAIECDERGHGDRDREKERKRQSYISTHLKCTFIRFNPHAIDFNLGDVIAQMRSLLSDPCSNHFFAVRDDDRRGKILDAVRTPQLN